MSIIRCLLRSCLEEGAEEEGNVSYQPPQMPPSHAIARSRSAGAERVPETVAGDAEEADDACCGGTEDTAAPESHVGALRALFARLRFGHNHSYDSLGNGERPTGHSPPPSPVPAGSNLLMAPPIPAGGHFGVCRRSLSSGGPLKGGKVHPDTLVPSPLHESTPHLKMASSFDASHGVPSIMLDEVVMPGSELQKQMAEVMSKELEHQDDECVICMEGFDPTNPRMPTLCGCGENKTYFHLPCLYQWTEQNKNCPSCRKRLRWEEF